MEVDPPPPQADPPHLCVDPPQSKSDTSAKTVPIKKKKRLPPVDETTNQSSEVRMNSVTHALVVLYGGVTKVNLR